MTGIPLHAVLEHIHLLHGSDASPRSDRELLRSFAVHNDQDAFAAVLRRHAPLVWGVCRRILGRHPDAEDCFQATFLQLARQAGSPRWQESVGGWLHTVAHRQAVRLRKQALRRRACEQQVRRAPPNASLQDLAVVVDEEVRRLPAEYRDPLLLHYLEGVTAEAAARQLGLSRGTFYNRLSRGRELLRQRLQRQGLALAAPLLAAVLAQEAEAVPPALIKTALRTATGSAPRSLAAGAIPTRVWTKLKVGLALGLLLSAAASGAILLAPPSAPAPSPPVQAPAQPVPRVDRHGDPLPAGAITRLGTLRFRAPAEILALAFAPDGKTLAVSSRAGLFLMDAQSGKRIKRLPRVMDPSMGDWGAEKSMLFSPDGKRLISQGHKVNHRSQLVPVVRVWDIVGDRRPKEHDVGPWLRWVGWSGDGQPLAVRVDDAGALHLHELSTERSRRFACAKPSRYPSGVISPDPRVACSPAAHLLVVPDAENVIHVWDTRDGRERCTLRPQGDDVYSLTFAPDGSRLVTITSKAVQMWEAATGKLIYTVAANRNYGPPAFSSDGKTLAIDQSWESIRFWDAATGKERGRTLDRDDFYSEYALSPDGKWLATAARHGSTFHLWEVATGRRKAEPVGHTNRPWGAVFSPDGRRVASGGSTDGTFRVWDSTTGEPLLCIQQPGMARECAFSPDGSTLLASWSSSGPALFDATTGKRRHVLSLTDPDRPKTYQSIISMHLSNDGKRLVTLSYYYARNEAGPHHHDTLITGWDPLTPKQLFQRRRPGMDSWLTVSADGRVLAAPDSADRARREVMAVGPMRLEDVATGERLLTFPALKGQTWPLDFSADDRLLAANNFDRPPGKDGKPGKPIRTVRLWEVLTAAEVLSLPVADSPCIAFARDGRQLALAAPDQEIVLWDLALGRERQRFRGFDSEVVWLRFSGDGRRLVSGLADSTLLVWEVAGAPPQKLSAEGTRRAWDDLGSHDARRAYQARGALAAAPTEAVAFLKEHIQPAQAAEAQRLRRLLADLDSEQFAVREKAQEELARLGDLAEPSLRRVLEGQPSLEVRRRVQALLERLRGPVTQPRLLQLLRAVAVLEDAGTPEARRLLEELAGGAAEARLTREARTAVRRLDLRSACGR